MVRSGRSKVEGYLEAALRTGVVDRRWISLAPSGTIEITRTTCSSPAEIGSCSGCHAKLADAPNDFTVSPDHSSAPHGSSPELIILCALV